MMNPPVPAVAPTCLPSDGPVPTRASFRDAVLRQLEHVNELQMRSDDLSSRFASGESVGVHEVMIAAEEASLGLQFALQIRNRALESLQEIMRTQV